MDPTKRDVFLQELRRSRLLAILRDAPDESLLELSTVLRECGIRFVEVAMNTPGAVRQIGRLRDLLDASFQVGAGTVLTGADAQAATSAGASFLVSPCFSREVQDFADERGTPTLPGALSPQEIWHAHRHGATLVKLFPASSAGGPSYLKEIRGPFRDIPVLVCGGVNSTNAREYLRAGADALAFGGSVFQPSRLREGDWDGIRTDLETLRATC